MKRGVEPVVKRDGKSRRPNSLQIGKTFLKVVTSPPSTNEAVVEVGVCVSVTSLKVSH